MANLITDQERRELQHIRRELGMGATGGRAVNAPGGVSAIDRYPASAPATSAPPSKFGRAAVGALEFGSRAVAAPLYGLKDLTNAGVNAVANGADWLVGKTTGWDMPYRMALPTNSAQENVSEMQNLFNEGAEAVGMRKVPAIAPPSAAAKPGAPATAHAGQAPGSATPVTPSPTRTPISTSSSTGATGAAAIDRPGQSGSDTGTGYAVVDGKRINYQDIGGKADPLRGSGGYVMASGGTSYTDPNVGLADREYEREVQDARQKQDQANLAGIGIMSPAAARAEIASRMEQQKLDQTGKAIDNQLDLEQQKLAINKPLIEAQAANNMAEAKAREFAVSPEGIKAELAKKAGEEGAKTRQELVKTYHDRFKTLNMPAGWEGKHMELAKKFAMADDPDNDYGIYYSPGSKNMGIGVSRKVFEPLLQHYIKAGYPKKDAMAHAFRDLKAKGAASGMRLYEDIPVLDRLPANANKPANDLGV